MLVSLYTVRIVLEALGKEDFGIYNVVGGVVVLFSFLSGTMASATQRYLSYELGKGEDGDCQKVFSVALISYFYIIILFLVLAESIGLWFVNTHLVFPREKLVAVNFVYQSSIISFVTTLLLIPYNAAIIASERMKMYAYSSIIEVILKLIVALLLPYIFFIEPLIAYSVLILLSIVSVQGFIYQYCRRNILFCRFEYIKDYILLKDMTAFAGWNMLGSIAAIMRGQGLNILINMFFCPAINAGYAISSQVNNAITNFSNNFYTAVRPQLSKLYSLGEKDNMLKLGCRSSRLAYLLLLFITTPVLVETNSLLEVWLENVPAYTVIFVRIMIVTSLIEVLAVPLVNMLQAAGKIRLYQLVVSIMYMFVFPISYLFLYFGYEPQTALIVNLSVVLVTMLPRLYICKKILFLSMKYYFEETLFRSLFTSGLLLGWILTNRMLIDNHTLLVVNLCYESLVAAMIIVLVGLNKEERNLLIKTVKRYGHICKKGRG